MMISIRPFRSFTCNASFVQPMRSSIALRQPLNRSMHKTGQASSKQDAFAKNQASSNITMAPVEEAPTHDRQLLSQPLSLLDVDEELWHLLDLCSDEELELLYQILHSNSPLSPIIKSVVAEKEPALLELRGRLSIMHKVETRFRFLAADPTALLSGRRPAYRETLLAIKDRVEVPCSSNLSTYDLETEIFVFITNNCLEYVQSTSGPDPSQAFNAATVTDGDGMSSSFKGSAGDNWVERVTAPIRFGVKELMPTVFKLGGAAAVTAAGRNAAQKLAGQVIASHVSYQAAARSAMVGWGRQVCLETAQKGLLGATARYSALKGAMSFLGPVMWGAFAVDLFLKSIGTDYARVIRAVFVLAQVRLLRTQGFVNETQSGADIVRPDQASLGGSSVVLASVDSCEEDEDELNIDDTCC